MADSFVLYNGTGALREFNIPFGYLQRVHIEVRVGGTLKTVTTHYVYLSASQIQFTVPETPPSGTGNVEIRRVTPVSTPFVDFSDGATLGEIDLDNNTLQLLYSLQEAKDGLLGAGGVLPGQGGHAGKFLTTSGVSASWANILKSNITDLTSFALTWLGLTDAAGARSNLSVYSQAQVDSSQAAQDATIAAKVPLSIIDAAEDLIVGSGADTVKRLAKGSEDDVLAVVGGVLAYRKDRRKCIIEAGSSSILGNGATAFYSSAAPAPGSEANAEVAMPFKGVMRNLYVVADINQGTNPTTFTARKGGADTALTCQMTSGNRTASDVTNSVSFNAGDLFCFKAVAGADIGGNHRYTFAVEYEEVP